MLADRVNGVLRRVPPWVIYLLGAVPFMVLVAQVVSGNLGADPVKTLERSLGAYGLKFMVATLCVSPLRWTTKISLLRFRRALGVLTFAYVALHLSVWVTLDLQFRWAEIGASILKRPYIIVGFLAFLMLLPLAITSNNASVRRLGAKTWQRLHMLTYPAAVLGAVHFVWLTKTWRTEPFVYLSVVGLLLAWRATRTLRRRLAQA